MTNVESLFKETNTKRRIASRVGCLSDLKAELPLFFEAYRIACEDYNREVIQTTPESRCRGFEASLLNSKLIHRFQKSFPDNWKYGRYKRFILNKNGYLFLIKKLDTKGKPMNIRTKLVENINSQLMSSLFQNQNCTEDPILYFGYRKDKAGNIFQPQVVYIDENRISWTIGENDISTIGSIGLSKPSDQPLTPKVRLRKKAAN